MVRYSRCRIMVDAEYVRRRAIYIYGSIKEMLKDLGYSTQRYYQIVLRPHASDQEECIVKLAKCLGVSVSQITYERNV